MNTPRPLPRLTLAALRGGSGKTTVSLGLISAWKNQGRRITPFKKGPDYIDAGWLAKAADSSCFNLDPYLMTDEQIQWSLYHRTSHEVDAAVIEGNRGLFDGTDQAGTYSTAELAKSIESPVVLVIDCTKATRTLAAVVYGCKMFDPKLNLAGVILNEVATARQEKLVRGAIESESGLPVLGAIPRVLTHDLPERHLGLVPHQEHPMARKALDVLGGLARDHLDLDGLWRLAESAPPVKPVPSPWPPITVPSEPRVRIGVIRDSVFQFYYPENLETFERLGAEIYPFSSLETDRLPQVDALCLGGGFPETHAEVLANNKTLRHDIRRLAQAGLPIYAECGGLMYLGQELVLGDNTYPMAGVFPVTFGLEKRPQGHGYATGQISAANSFFDIGTRLTGHEFHYSRPLAYDPKGFDLVMDVQRGHGFDQGRDGLSRYNVFASYIHLHALGTTVWAEALVKLARTCKSGL